MANQISSTKLAASYAAIGCVMMLSAIATASRVCAQAPDWMLPLGATVETEDMTSEDGQSLDQSLGDDSLRRRDPSSVSASLGEAGGNLNDQHLTETTDARPKPTRLPAIARPIRLPIPAVTKEKPRKAVTAQPYDGLSQLTQSPTTTLLAPKVSSEGAGLQPTATPVTSYNPIAFDQSIEASVVSFPGIQPIGALEDGSFATPALCDSPLAAPCESAMHAHEYYADFSPTPVVAEAMYADAGSEQWVYDAKHDVPTQYPWIQWGREFYGDGITPRGKNWFGEKNLARPEFYVYGDFRSGISTGRNESGRIDNWANRLNLDMDLRVTDTERFHAFVGPLDNGAQFSRWELVGGDPKYRSEIDLTPVTGYFEGDLGVLMGTAQNRTSPFELPFTIGLVPLLFQNGIWMEDAVTGAAFALPARHSRLLNWSNYDATFFAVVDQLNSPAFGANDHAAQAFGTAWFIEAYRGYIETGYAYVRDRNFSQRSYHNITASYTRRYFDRISNSLRVIVNAGQDLPDAARTADGVLLLVENSWITSSPLTVVPYANFFVGWDRPQSVARAGVSGGILRNTGINFEIDGLNGYPTLDATGSDTAGGSIGIDLIGDDLDRQLLLEASFLTPHGSKNLAVPGDQYAVGTRYQFPISNSTLLRFDSMYGWRRGLRDVYGTRMEYRWKF